MAETSRELLKGLGFVTDPTKAKPAMLVGEEELARAREREATGDRGFFESIPTAIEQSSVIAAGLESLNKITNPIPSEQGVSELSDEWLSSYVNPLQDKTAYEDIIKEAKEHGLPRAEALSKSYQVEQTRIQELNAAGWKGATAQVMVELTEELGAIAATSYAVSTVTGPLAPVTGTALTAVGGAVKAKKAYGKLRALYAGTAIGSVEAGAFEYLRSLNRYDYTGQDVLLAMGFGAAAGGGLNVATTAFRRRGKAAAIEAKIANNEKLTPDEEGFHKVFNNDATTLRMIKKELDNEAFLNDLDKAAPKDTLAKRIETGEAFVPQAAGFNLATKYSGLDFLRKMISTNARDSTSNLDTLRSTNAALVMNSTGYKIGPDGKRVATNQSASEHQEIISAQFRSPYMVQFYENSQAWKKRTGGTLLDYETLVSRAARGILDQVDPEVKKLADLVLKQEKALANMGIKADVAGFTPEVIGRHLNYLPRIFNDRKITSIRQRFGANTEANVTKLVEAAIRKAQPNIEANVRQALVNKGRKKITDAEVKKKVSTYAKGYAQSIVSPKQGFRGGASEINLEDLKEVMGKNGVGIEEDLIEDLIETFSAKAKVKGHPRSRPRMLLDESTSIKVKNETTGELEDLHFYDLLEENITQLHNNYIFQMGGAIGLARNGINTNSVNSGFDNVKNLIREEGAAKGLTKAQIEDSLVGIDFAYDGITGRLANRKEVRQGTAEFNMAMRAFSFSVSMGMSGMSALMELTNALFETSTMVMFKSMPAYRKLLTDAANGDLPDNVVQELVEGLGLGNEVAMGRFNNFNRYENSNLEGVIAPEVTGFAKFAGEAQQKVAYWSGLQGVTQTLRRLAMLQFTNAWGTAVKTGKMPFHPAKLEQLGLDEDKIKALMNDMKEYSTITKDGRVTKLNLKEWSEEGREAFQASGFKEARQSVQEMNIGSSNPFLRGEIGKTYFQFLSFPLASMEQQAARLAVRGARGDVMSVAKIITAAALQGSLLYTARVYMNAEGRSDRKKYLKRNLSMDRLITGSLSQIGAFSLFGVLYSSITGAVNGSNNSSLMTPPALGLGTQVIKTLYNAGDAALTGEGWSENDWRTFLRIAPAQSLYGFRQLLNHTANEFGN